VGLKVRKLFSFKHIVPVIFISSAASFTAQADSKSMRKKEPGIFLVTIDTDESVGRIFETSLGYSFGQASESSLAIGYAGAYLERDFTKAFTLAAGTFLYGGTREILQTRINNRIFLGNSLSFVFGAGARRSTTELGLFDNSYLWYHHASLKSEYLFGSLGVGNQWTFDSGLVIGVDWAVVSKSFFRTETLSYRSNGLGEEQIRNINEAITVWLRQMGQFSNNSGSAFHFGFRF
jgi:hypothetical protein